MRAITLRSTSMWPSRRVVPCLGTFWPCDSSPPICPLTGTWYGEEFQRERRGRQRPQHPGHFLDISSWKGNRRKEEVRSRGRFICVVAAGAMALIGLRTTAQRSSQPRPRPAERTSAPVPMSMLWLRLPTTGATAGTTAAGGTGRRRTAGCGTAMTGSGVPYDANHAPPAVPRPAPV